MYMYQNVLAKRFKAISSWGVTCNMYMYSPATVPISCNMYMYDPGQDTNEIQKSITFAKTVLLYRYP